MSSVSFDLQEANLSSIKDFSTILLVGMRGAGKTTYAKHIVGSFRDRVDRFAVFCGNLDNVYEWQDVVHEGCVMGKDIDALKDLREYQNSKVPVYKKLKKPVPKKYKVCVVVDDWASDKKMVNHKVLQDIFSNGRHYGMFLVIIIQYWNQLNRELRFQIDYIGLLNIRNEDTMKKVFKEFVNLGDERIFKYAMLTANKDWGMCWIENRKSVLTMQECVFFYKVDHEEKVAPVGSQRVRAFVERHTLVGDGANKIMFDDSDEIRDADEDEDLEDGFNLDEIRSVFTDRKGTITIFKQSRMKEKVE